MELRFHPAALAELRKSTDFYLARSLQASQRFAVAVEDALKAVQGDPERYIKVGSLERACRVDKFPFQVIYRAFRDVIFVVAIAHTSRRPGYWKRR